MDVSGDFYLVKLREAFSQRQKQNVSYSLRAFARDLDIDPSNLSAILRNKRRLPETRAQHFASELSLSPMEESLFINSVFQTRRVLDEVKLGPKDRRILWDEIYFRVISEWEYYAFLKLMQTDGFRSDRDWICSRLDITGSRFDVILSYLLEIGFVGRDDTGTLTRQVPSLETSEDVTSKALRQGHREQLDLAKKRLDEVPVADRDYSSMTLAVDKRNLRKLKAAIREFQDKLELLAAQGTDKKEVYLFTSQLFPLTQPENEP